MEEIDAPSDFVKEKIKSTDEFAGPVKHVDNMAKLNRPKVVGERMNAMLSNIRLRISIPTTCRSNSHRTIEAPDTVASAGASLMPHWC